LNTKTPSSWWSRHAVTLIATLSVLAYALFIHAYWGWSKVLSVWMQVGLPTIVLSIAALVATQFIRTHRMGSYFPDLPKGSFFKLYRLTQIHNLLNIMMPFRTGETSFPVLMRSEFGLPIMRGASALVVLRLLDLHALLLAAGLAWAGWALFLIAPVLLFPVSHGVLAWARKRLPAKLAPKLDDISTGLPAHIPAFIRAWALTVVNWLIKVLVLGFALSLMGVDPLAAAFGGAVGGELSSVLPFHAPAGVGTYPAGIVAGAAAFGADRAGPGMDLVMQASINGHLLIIVSALAATAIALPLGRRRSPDKPPASKGPAHKNG